MREWDAAGWQVLPGLATSKLGTRVLLLDEVDSTNRYLKERAGQLPHGTVCCTDYQNAGRGRLGRTWTAPRAAALALSVLFREEGPAAQLPLLCGIAVANALEALTGASFAIKWPNDIVCSGRKVCGILCESRPVQGGGLAVVAGIGVNLLQDGAWFAEAGLPFGGSVAMLTEKTLSPWETAAAVLNRLEPLWERCRAEGFGALEPAYAARCISLGRQVRALSPAGEVRLEGTAVGIGPDGSLLIDDGRQVQAVAAGETSVRGFDGYI